MKKLWVIFAALILMACSKEKNYVDCENCKIIITDNEGNVVHVIDKDSEWEKTMTASVCKCTSYCEFYAAYKQAWSFNPNIKFECK